MYRSHVLVCGGTGCTSSNSAKIIETLNEELVKNNLQNEIKVIKTGCFGLCALCTDYGCLSGRRFLQHGKS